MTELLLIFVNNLLPIFLAAGVGALLSWKAKIDVRPISKILFYIFSPCLVLKMILTNYSPGMPLGSLALIVFLTQGILALFIVFVAKMMKYDRGMIVAMVLPVMTINAGNMGMPICLFVFGEEGLVYATFFFLVSILGTYTMGVVVASLGKQTLKQSMLGLLKLPMIYSVLIAFVLILLDWQLPLPIQRTVDILGDAAIPTMLVVLGMQLQKAKLKENIPALAICTSTRLVLGPLVILGLSIVFGLSGIALHTTIIQGGMPGAVTSTVLATEYDTKPEFVTAAVTIATILSPLTLTPLIALLN